MQGDAAHLNEKSREPSAANPTVNKPFVLCKRDVWVLWWVSELHGENTSYGCALFHAFNYYILKLWLWREGFIRHRAFVCLCENITYSLPCFSSPLNPYRMHPLKNVSRLYNGHVYRGGDELIQGYSLRDTERDAKTWLLVWVPSDDILANKSWEIFCFIFSKTQNDLCANQPAEESLVWGKPV